MPYPLRSAPVTAGPLAAAIPLDPLEFLRYEHFRQRALCDRLEEIADGRRSSAAAADAGWALDYLTVDLALHVADEGRDLLPLLERLCKDGDRLDEIEAQLDREHAFDAVAMAGVVDGLHEIAGGRQPADRSAFIRAARVFAATLRRHLIWENRVLMPLARRRIGPVDRVQLGLRFATRRGALVGGGETRLAAA